MPGDRRDGVPQGSRGEPVRLPELRLPPARRCERPASASSSTTAHGRRFRRRQVPLDPLRFRDERRYTERLKAARTKTGLEDAVLLGAGSVEGVPVVAAVQDFDFMGGSLGMAAAEAIIAGADGGARAARALHPLRRVRRRAHAGGHPLADAAAAHHHRHRHAEGGRAALHRGAHQSDDRRRHRLLRHARRRASRRARRADRLCRPARHRADHPRAAARRLSALRVSAASTAWSTSSCTATSCARPSPALPADA